VGLLFSLNEDRAGFSAAEWVTLSDLLRRMPSNGDPLRQTPLEKA
jgi:hypothetical protein